MAILPVRRPYAWLIALICLLILAATTTELVLPYLTKTSLDRYIVASARKVNLDAAQDPALKVLAGSYMPLFLDSGQTGIYFLPGDRTGRIDPGDLRRLEQAGIIQSEPYYLTDPNQDGLAEVLHRNHSLFQVFPKAAAIAVGDLKKLERPDVIRLRSGDIRGLAYIALWCVIVLVIGYLLNVTQVVLLEYVGQRITHDLRQDLLTHVVHQSIAFHDRHSKGKLVARLTNDVQNLNEMVTNVAVTFFKDMFILAGIVAMMLYLDLKLALIAFALLPIVGLVTDVFRRKAREVYRELRKKVGQINASFAETIAGIQIIQAFRREEDNNRRFIRLNHDNFEAGYRQIRLFAIFMPLVELAAAISLALIIWYGGLNVLHDAITIGVVVAFVAYSQKLYQPIRELSEKFNILQSSLASLERIFMLRDQQSAMPEPAVPQTVERGPGHIRFDRVDFSYTHGEEILKDITFEVKPGETLAIVGPTGAGKTSIINLLLRFYDPESGAIFIDGSNIRDLDLPSHRSRIGLVMQDVFIFAGFGAREYRPVPDRILPGKNRSRGSRGGSGQLYPDPAGRL